MERIRSVHYLRGVSALLVFYAHVVVVGTTSPNAASVYFPMISGPAYPPESFSGLSSWLAPEIWVEKFGLNLGHLGVSAFFMISGYLIMATLQRKTTLEFAAGRLFRIFPTSLFVTFFGASVFAFYLLMNGYENPYSLQNTILSSVLLPVVGPPIPVIWSLVVEVWFYAIIAFSFLVFKRQFGLLQLIATACVCLVIVCAVSPIRLFLPKEWVDVKMVHWTLWYICYNITFVIFVFAGAAVYLSERSGNILNGILSISVILAIFWSAGRAFEAVYPGALGFHLINSIAGVIVFCLFLSAGRLVPRVRILGFFSDISYPLYLVHIPLSWLVLWWLARHGVPGWLSVLAALALCTAVSYAIHILIEMPSHRYGRTWSARPRIVAVPGE